MNLPTILRLSVLSALIVSATTLPAHARDREISVSGTCTRLVSADRGAIVLTAEYVETDIETAAKKATGAYERTRAAIQRLNLENLDLKTAEYSVSEVKEWEKNHFVSKGFKARMGLRVATSAIPRIGEVIAIAAREGLRDVGGLTTFLSQEKTRKEHIACLQDAAENAKAKAEKLAASLGAQLGDVVSLTEQGAPSRPVVPLMETLGAVATKGRDMAPPPVEAGQQELTLSIIAVFGIR